MSDSDDRRIADAQWRGETTEILKGQNKSLARIEAHLITQNGRIGSLEISRARNAWLLKALTIVGLGALVKAFSND